LYSATASRSVSSLCIGEPLVVLHPSNRRSGERWRIGRGQMCRAEGDRSKQKDDFH
jgi:hypothetical protein